LRKFRDIRVTVRNLTGLASGASAFAIRFVIRGPDLVALADYGERLRRSTPELGGIVDADTTLRLDRPEWRVEIDRERAADLRVETEQIATALRLGVGGDDEVSRFHDPVVNEDYDVTVRLTADYRGRADVISRLYVARSAVPTATGTGAQPQIGLAPGGGLVRLDNLVKLVPSVTRSRFDRSERQREVRLRASIVPGFGPADRIQALREEVAEMNRPGGDTPGRA